MDKSTAAQRASLQKKKAEAEKHISQLKHQQKILLNRLRKEERNARTSRLCRHSAILEGIFPAIITMDGESVKAFLIALYNLPGARELEEKMLNSGATEQVTWNSPANKSQEREWEKYGEQGYCQKGITKQRLRRASKI